MRSNQEKILQYLEHLQGSSAEGAVVPYAKGFWDGDSGVIIEGRIQPDGVTHCQISQVKSFVAEAFESIAPLTAHNLFELSPEHPQMNVATVLSECSSLIDDFKILLSRYVIKCEKSEEDIKRVAKRLASIIALHGMQGADLYSTVTALVSALHGICNDLSLEAA